MNVEVEILLCDITKLEVDAIVNSANSSLRMGSGLSGAIIEQLGLSFMKSVNNMAH